MRLGSGIGVEQGKNTDLSLTRQSMDFLQAGPGYSTLEDAVILLCIDVEGFFIKRGIVLDLIDGVWFAVFMLMDVCGWWLDEKMRRVGDGCMGGRRMRRRMS